MNVTSTRGGETVPLATAIARGQAHDGGLYMPPLVPPHRGPWGDTFCERAFTTLRPFFVDDALAPRLRTLPAIGELAASQRSPVACEPCRGGFSLRFCERIPASRPGSFR